MTWGRSLWWLLIAGAACRARDPIPVSKLEPAAPAAAVVVPDARHPTPNARPEGIPDSGFAPLVERLSEPGGFFDSDNIISNETSYLHVVDALRRLNVRGGAYIGVGPDQNFSYIAVIRPAIAFMLDIRRDNMFEHLLFKSLFAMARNRLEYLCLLVGKPPPADVDAWSRRTIADIVAYVDSAPTNAAFVAATQRAIDKHIADFGLQLSPRDLVVADRYRAEFVADGLGVRYSSLNRNNRAGYPDLEQLILSTDRAGKQASFLATEDGFQFVKRMQATNLVVPVVGNLAGDKAMRAIAAYMSEQHLTVSALYTSNAEQYIFRDGLYARFAANVKALPRDSSSVFIRSYFGRFGIGHPLAVPGHLSTQILQRLDTFVKEYDAGSIVSYNDVVMRGYLPP